MRASAANWRRTAIGHASCWGETAAPTAVSLAYWSEFGIGGQPRCTRRMSCSPLIMLGRWPSAQLKTFGDCRFRFDLGVLPRCSLCPLFDAERAIRDLLGENGPPGMVFEIRFGPRVQALLRGESPPGDEKGLDRDWQVPDFAPEEWRNPSGDERAS